MVRSMGRFAEGLLALLLFMFVWWRLNGLIPVVRYVQAVVVVLLLMLGYTGGIMVERLLRYRAARNQSRIFVQQVGGALLSRDFDQAIAIAGRYSKSPIAKVVASGLVSFQAAMPLLCDAKMIEAAKRAMRRSATLVHAELRRGFNPLASVASTAPLVGAFGTVFGIIDSFRGCGAERSVCMAATAGALSEALVPAALGLLVAVPTLWCCKYLRSELEASDLEMGNKPFELVSYLTIYLRQRRQFPAYNQDSSGLIGTGV
jgi:biopolymer transport protein ExbB/TolQ